MLAPVLQTHRWKASPVVLERMVRDFDLTVLESYEFDVVRMALMNMDLSMMDEWDFDVER